MRRPGAGCGAGARCRCNTCLHAPFCSCAGDRRYIPLPSALHVPWVRKAAAAGRHILLEKPVAVDGAELDAILAACSEAGVQLMDGTM